MISRRSSADPGGTWSNPVARCSCRSLLRIVIEHIKDFDKPIRSRNDLGPTMFTRPPDHEGQEEGVHVSRSPPLVNALADDAVEGSEPLLCVLDI